MVRKTLDEDMMPLVLGGDHSIAVGTAAGVAAHFHKESKRVGHDLARRARRHEHAGNVAFGKRARDAARVDHGLWPGGADRARAA